MPQLPTVTVVHGRASELRGQELLLEGLAMYDLDRWNFVQDVRFDDEIQTSNCRLVDGYPRITLRAVTPETEARLGDMTIAVLLNLYLHEQLHMYLALHEGKTCAAITDLRRRYPAVPVGPPEGARSEFSTYLHLVLCALEIQATAEVLGREKARQIKSRSRGYRFIYHEVLATPTYFDALLERHGLKI